MIKERTWPVRVMYMLIAAALAISLIITAAPAHRVSAADSIPDAEWDMVSTPSEDGWVLAPDTTIIDYAVAEEGKVAYAIVYNSSGDPFLLKSDDHAATWEDDPTDALVDELEDEFGEYGVDFVFMLLRVATDAEDSDFVAVALALNVSVLTPVHVCTSTDGGATFRDTGEVEDGGYFFISPMDVTDLAVSPEDDGEREIAIVGTWNWTESLIFRSTAVGEFSTGWDDARYDGWDNRWTGSDPTNDIISFVVTDVKFAPSWSADKTILVTTVNFTDDSGTPGDPVDDLYDVHLQYGTWGTTEGWNEQSVVAMEATLITLNPVRMPMYVFMDARGLAGLTLPLDFAGRHADKRYVWVWVNYYDGLTNPAGTIYRVKNGAVNAIGWQVEDETVWLTNVSYLGYISDGKAIAGVLGSGGYAYNASDPADLWTDCCEGVQVYRNDNIVNMDICCYDWEPACKPPTGMVAMAAFYVSDDPASSKAYAVALYGVYPGYDEGAWSVSWDDGYIWNQLSLIDTRIDYLSDVAVSPDCNKTMLVSINTCTSNNETECCGCDSVWLHAENLPEAEEYSGKWLRTWCDMLVGDRACADEWGLLRLAPEETTGDTVYLVDYDTDTVYWNEMETLGCWEDGTATVDHIVDLAVKDKETIYALDENGTVAMSDDYALGWHEPVDSLVDNGHTIAVWGDHILVGGCDGDVSYSDDGGETFELLEDISTGGYVTVAFDSYFDTNDTVYAALARDDSKGGVYRWVIDESEVWKDLRAEPLESQIGIGDGTHDYCDLVEVHFTGLVVDNADGNPMTDADTGGVLYASYYGSHNSTWFTGVARYLTPAEDVVCKECGDWDYLIMGLYEGLDTSYGESFRAWPDALKICGCLTPDTNSKLFAIDSWAPKGGYDMEEGEDGTVWRFEDCYAKKAPDLTSPADDEVIAADPCSCYSEPFTFMWGRLCDACSYDIQISLDEDFYEVVFDSTDLCNDMLCLPCTYNPPAGEAPSYHILGGLAGGLSCATTYYWRVRAADAATGQIIHSWWSEHRSVMIAPNTAAGEITLVSPEPGATGVAIKNVGFSWDLSAEADEFYWVLSANSDLSSPIEEMMGLTTTAYGCTEELEYDTTYYWQVTAYNEDLAISTSAIGTFTTMAEPEDVTPPPPPTTPTWVWVIIAIGAVLVIVVIVLIFRTRRV